MNSSIRKEDGATGRLTRVLHELVGVAVFLRAVIVRVVVR